MLGSQMPRDCETIFTARSLHMDRDPILLPFARDRDLALERPRDAQSARPKGFVGRQSAVRPRRALGAQQFRPRKPTPPQPQRRGGRGTVSGVLPQG
jgi:hypothetical protein